MTPLVIDWDKFRAGTIIELKDTDWAGVSGLYIVESMEVQEECRVNHKVEAPPTVDMCRLVIRLRLVCVQHGSPVWTLPKYDEMLTFDGRAYALYQVDIDQWLHRPPLSLQLMRYYDGKTE